MRLSCLSLITLFGCGPVTATLINEVQPSDTDTDTDTDSDADTDTDTDTDTDADPVPLTWQGSRYFEFSWGCEDKVEETGTEVWQENDTEGAWAGCGDCDLLFNVTMNKDEICDGYIPLTNPAYRGLILNGSSAEVYWVYKNNENAWTRAELTDDANWDGQNLEYFYSGNGGGGSRYDVECDAVIK